VEEEGSTTPQHGVFYWGSAPQKWSRREDSCYHIRVGFSEEGNPKKYEKRKRLGKGKDSARIQSQTPPVRQGFVDHKV
jgi:hypothetical protein